VVERDLAKVDVAGSTPVSRSRNLTGPALRGFSFFKGAHGRWTFQAGAANLLNRGAVPKW
jgi:hypothetical protein